MDNPFNLYGTVASPVPIVSTLPPDSDPLLLGLSLDGFREFLAAYGGRDSFEGMTTDNVKRSFLLPATSAARASYCDLLRARTSPHVSRANRFVSHVYTAPFMKGLCALEAWEVRQVAAGDAGPFFYYFDLFVVNQHAQSAVVPFEVLRDEFGRGVRGVGHTLLIMEWKEAVALKV
jgi:hypothetical protein